jgi:hypothetical protein
MAGDAIPVSDQKKTCRSRWIISWTPLCATVARDCLPNAEADDQTATPGGPTASRSHATTRSCTPLAAAVVEVIVVLPSSTYVDLYALLQCDEDSEYEHKAYNGCIEVF